MRRKRLVLLLQRVEIALKRVGRRARHDDGPGALPIQHHRAADGHEPDRVGGGKQAVDVVDRHPAQDGQADGDLGEAFLDGEIGDLGPEQLGTG